MSEPSGKNSLRKKAAWIALAVIICGWIIYRGAVLPSLRYWGSTKAELAMKLPGDELVPQPPILIMNHAITIDVPAAEIYPYFVQLGQDRAGFYSFDWLERLSGFGIHNSYTIHPEWQNLKAGDFVTFHQKGMGMRVAAVEPGKYIVLITDSRDRNHPLPPGKWEFFPVPDGKYVAWNWIFCLQPISATQTRVYSRTYATWTDSNPFLNFALANAFELPSDVMDRKMLLTIKELAEAKHASKP
jgi:hypothetical protein